MSKYLARRSAKTFARSITPNENKLSHRWRDRTSLQSLVLKSCESYSSERPAVGWSDWLGLFVRSRLESRKITIVITQSHSTAMTISRAFNFGNFPAVQKIICLAEPTGLDNAHWPHFFDYSRSVVRTAKK